VLRPTRAMVRSVSGFLLAVAVMVGATPEVPARRSFNVEPLVVGAVGLVAAGVGAWRLVESERMVTLMGQLVDEAQGTMSGLDFERTCGDARTDAGALLRCGRALQHRGTIETVLGNTLVIMGSVLVVASVVWLLVEGFERSPIVVTPALTPTGGAVVVQGRF
jgi:Co/Zn/Cd efflux system component